MRIERKLRQRLINKLYDAGFEDEQSIKGMEVHDFMKLNNISLGDINTFLELQIAIKKNKVVSFLAGLDLDLNPRRKKAPPKQNDEVGNHGE